MQHRTLKLALAQMQIAPGEKEQNLRQASHWISDAARMGAQLVLLPEAMPLGWMAAATRELADEIPNGQSCAHLSAAARELNLYICSGLVERAGAKVFNSAVLINPAGQVIHLHRKLNELDIAHGTYALGDRLAVVDTPLGRIGLMICADGFADGQCLSRSLGYMGADLILSPAAWAVDADHDNSSEPYGKLWLDNYQPVAQDFQLWIASCSNTGPIDSGPWAGRKCIGASLIVGPRGERMQAPYDRPGLQVYELQLAPRPAQGTDWSKLFGRPVR